MSGVHFDTSQVDRLAVDLSDARFRIQRNAKQVVRKSAGRIEDTMRRDATGHRHLPQLQNYVGKDSLDDGYGYRIGFAKAGQGDLANVACFGTVNNFPVMDLNHGLRLEVPRLTQQLGSAAENSVLGGPE